MGTYWLEDFDPFPTPRSADMVSPTFQNANLFGRSEEDLALLHEIESMLDGVMPDARERALIVTRQMLRYYTARGVAQWMNRTLIPLRGKTPEECLRTGNVDAVLSMLAFLEYGLPS